MAALVSSKEKRLRRRLAANVYALRTKQKLTVEAAAWRAALDARHWQKIEAAENSVTLRTLAKLADGLGVDVAELLCAKTSA